METKQIAAAALIIVALGIIYYILVLSPEPTSNGGIVAPGDYPPPFVNEGDNSTMQEFASNLLAASKFYIVEDLRGLERYPLSKQNIMQCGVDYAGSPGLVGKEFAIHAFDDGDLCYTVDGTVAPISECYEELQAASEDPDTAIIWIEKGTESEVYSRGLLVRLSDTYVQGTCKTTLLIPVPEEEPEANETLPEINISEMEGPGPVIINETTDSSENGTTEEETPGDSITFP